MKMISWKLMGSLLVTGLSFTPGLAAEASTIEELKKQLLELQQNLETQRQHMQIMQSQLRVLEEKQSAPRAKEDGRPQLVENSVPNSSPANLTGTPPEAAASGQHWQPSDPLRFSVNQRAYMDISFDGLFSAGTSTADDIEGGTQLGGHDPNQRGFTVQNLETTLAGAVDPYLRGQANIIMQIDRQGESFLEVEEAFLETLSLPGRLQIKAGQYFTEFGRLNQFHPHAWDFVDTPLVNGRFLGPDGLRSAGARISWLAPTPFYSEFFFSIQNSQGETAASFRNDNGGEPIFGRQVEQGSVKSLGDLLFVPRYVTSFDISDSQTLVLGASAAFGPNSSGPDNETEIYGLDAFWKWRPVTQAKGFPFVSWQTEAMLRRYRAGAFDWDLNGNGLLDPEERDANGDLVSDVLPGETLKDWGFYSQVLWGIRPRWVLGLRGDYLAGVTEDYERIYGRDLNRADRWRVSPNLTWYPSEFSKLRLQYNYDDRQGLGVDHSIWLQFEFLLGSHAAHKF